MLALIFEVKPGPSQLDRYLGLAAQLRPELDRSGGCLFLDRFRNLERPGWFLSFQLWQDEAAMSAWRQDPLHREAQRAGRREVLEDYRLRVGQVVGQGGSTECVEASGDAMRRFAIEERPGSAGAPEPGVQRFQSLYRADEYLRVWDVLQPWVTAPAAEGLGDAPPTRHLCRLLRDYGLRERAQAPQVYPPPGEPE